MQEKERDRVLSRNFTGWLLIFGELVKQSEVFQIRDVNEANRVMSVTINGREILVVLNPDNNTLTWRSGQGTLNLSELGGNGWAYSKGREIFDQKDFEALSSPRITTSTGDVQIFFKRHPEQGDTSVIRANFPKSS